MTSSADSLQVAIRRVVHEGLTIDLTLALGRELGVLFGPSGAGKTTILKLIAGLETPDSGVVEADGVTFFDDRRLINRRLRERRVGYVFQHNLLFPHLDVAGNLRFGLKGQSKAAIGARVAEVADLFEIGPLLRRRVETLSGGERQRIGLARAMAPHPRVLLCDEPVSALDLDARYRLLTRLKAVQQAELIPTLLVTHSVDEALAFGDRLFMLDQGRVVASGRSEQMLGELSTRPLLESSQLQNVFAGMVSGHSPLHSSSTIQLDGGPSLVIGTVDQAVGARVFVRIASEEIVLGRGPVGALSARNLIGGTIDQIYVHDRSAEVAVRVQGLVWMVGIIEPTIRSLQLEVGDAVELIIKARNCHLLTQPRTRPLPDQSDR